MLDVHVQPCGAFLVRPSFVCGAAGESRPQCYFISRSTVETERFSLSHTVLWRAFFT